MKKISGMLIAALIFIVIGLGINTNIEKKGHLSTTPTKVEQTSKDDDKQENKNNESGNVKNKNNENKDDSNVDKNNESKQESNKQEPNKQNTEKQEPSKQQIKNESINNNNNQEVFEENDKNEKLKNKCKISISCKTAIDTGVNKKQGFTHLPSDGWILSQTTVEFNEGDTVYDVLQKIVLDKKIHMEYSGVASTIYVEGIDNLYEFDGGRWSGWMYCVNGWYPNYGCGTYKLKDEDTIQWNYTCDLGEDLGQTWLGKDIKDKEQ
jgi:hypothetical protein